MQRVIHGVDGSLLGREETRCLLYHLHLSPGKQFPGLFAYPVQVIVDADLPPKSLILLGKDQIFFRNYIFVSACRDLLVQRRKTDAQIRGNAEPAPALD